jgi:thiaminase/transcriptional activator TenA
VGLGVGDYKRAANLQFLTEVVEKTWRVITDAETHAQELFSQLKTDKYPDLPEKLIFLHAEDILDKYPDLPRKQRETEILKKYPAIFIYSIAGAKAPDWDGFRTLHALADGVLEELQLHAQYAAVWGVDVTDVQPGAATRRYTDFLLATTWAYDTGVTVVAMSPCMRPYAYLGQQLAQQKPPEHQYIDWIRTLSSLDFEDLAQQLEELADRYASDTHLVRATYRYAMECERDFFQATFDSVNLNIS